MYLAALYETFIEVLQFFIVAGYDDVLSAVISKETRIRELLMMPLIRDSELI